MRQRMVAGFVLMAVMALLTGASVLCAQDKIVAVVNGDIITQRDLDNFINVMRIQLSGQYSGPQLEERMLRMRKDLLQRLIEDRLILQVAKKEKVAVDESRIDAKIDEIQKRYGSRSAFEQALAAQGLAEADLRQKFRDQLLMFRIIEAKIRSKIIISPREITDYYTRNPEEFKLGQEREFDSIVVDNEAAAQKISEQLKSGADLAELSKEYQFKTNRFTAHKGGELKKEIEDVVFALKLKEVSSPLAIEGKQYIFRLNQISPERQRTLPEVQAGINELLFEKKMQGDLVKWLDQLKKTSYIKVFA